MIRCEKFKVPNYKQQKTGNEKYNEYMEQELKILKRQNREFNYERPKLGEDNLDDDEQLMDNLRILSEGYSAPAEEEEKIERKKDFEFSQMTAEDILSSLNLPMVNLPKGECQKDMNFNKDPNHIYNNLSTEEKLKHIQNEIKETRRSTLKSDRDEIVEGLKNAHNECFFGQTLVSNTIAYKTYDSYCRKWEEMKWKIEYNNRQFQTKLKGSHIKVNEISTQYHTDHLITCGVQPIHITRDQNKNLTQFISFICFDSINNNTSSPLDELNSEEESSSDENDKTIKSDL